MAMAEKVTTEYEKSRPYRKFTNREAQDDPANAEIFRKISMKISRRDGSKRSRHEQSEKDKKKTEFVSFQVKSFVG